MAKSCQLLAFVAAVTCVMLPVGALTNFDYSEQPIPYPFRLHDRYPNREETDVCRPIFDHIQRNSARFTNELVLSTNPHIAFASVDARRMTSRMQTRLDRLSQLYIGDFTVLKAWTQYPDREVKDSASLHYEGRTVRVNIQEPYRISEFLTNAVQAAFDWVSYESNNYVRLSVIPDNCENNVDMVFILDQSGSVGPHNHGLAIQFILNVIQFFSIASDATRVGFVAFSRYSHIEFDLDRYTSADSVANRIRYISYRGGSTATALGLNDTALLLNPANNRGARPASKGIPKVAILITDGKSNRHPLTYAVPYIKSFGVQVYALGIANPDVEELQLISSDPDSQHVFLLNSYNDAAGFVDFLSIQTCDTPAIIDPGDNTTTDVPEDGIRYFQVECDSFSNTVLVELYDNTGTSFLYCSATEQNPGPLTSNTVFNNTVGITTRTCVVSLANSNSRVVYIGVQGRDGTNQFTVVVWDLLFTPDKEEIVILEGQTGPVYNVSANLNSRANGIVFTYNIIEGNSGGVFSIDGDGQVTVPSSGLSFDDSSFYSLSIVAENIDESCQRSRFRLDIRVGRNQIMFSNLEPVSILETATVGTDVTTIRATGGAGRIEYSIISSNVPFTIGRTNGTITVDDNLNFEDEMLYNVIIQVDSVGTIVSDSATQVVTITDVNEQPEWITPCARTGSCVAKIQENLQEPQNVGSRFEVTDADLPSVPNGQIVYRISPSDAQLPFSIDSNGLVSTTESLDREVKEFYSFTVIAMDRGTPALSVSTTFLVTVEDVNDVEPMFIQGPAVLTIPENDPEGTVIAQYIATDSDTPTNAEITYSLSPDTGLPFRLNASNGVLSIAEVLDYENPMSREFFINVTANNPPLLSTTMTQIIVTDVNDNTPVFDRESYTASIPEHSANNTLVETVRATDADSGLNGDIRYTLSGGNSQGYFTISAITGAITVAADIDREQIGSVELRVRAKDRGSPRLFSFATVTVIITDINDHPPVFNPEQYFVTLGEDAQVNTVPFTVYATDGDKPGTVNSMIVYSIEQGNIGEAFSIDSTSGDVKINNALNHEAVPSYTLIIQAVDQGIPQMSATATAQVTVNNVNEAPPTLSGDQSIDIPENIPINVAVANFTASDPDFMPVSITIISGNDEGKFRISDDGVISIAGQLDFELIQSYMLTIQADDGDATDEASLSVNVLDVNEFPPVFFGPTSFTVEEESPAHTVVGTVSATDGDGSAPNNKITYTFSLQNSIDDYFLLDSSSGEITTAAVLDREMLTDLFPIMSSSLSVQIFARDGGSPFLQNVRMYTITLQDINDNTPEFGDNGYSNSIFENQPPQVILSFSATDIDLGSNADIRFSFTVDPSEGEILFELEDNRVGNISTTKPLDCEAQTSYSFNITATDQGNPPRSTRVPGTLSLRDQNDNDPIFTENPYTFEVDENARVETTVGQVVANDADKGSNGEVFYEILGQDELEEESESAGGGITFFAINSETGEIRHQTPFDFESFPEVTVTVRANDRGTPRRLSTAEVMFTVRNVDESAPRFSPSCSDVRLSENTPPNSLIVNCAASDPDNTTTPDDSEWITYAIESGNTDNTFEIGLNTGEVRNAIELDYETNNFFSLVINATDGSGRTARRTVDIELEDENDNAPDFQLSSYSFAMSSEEIMSNTQMVARVRASDSDTGKNGEVSYSIEENGIKRVSSSETQIIIIARDGADTPQTSTVTLSVQFDEECLLQKYTVNPRSGDVFASVLCSVQIYTENKDVVMGNNHTAYCRVIRNSPARYQWLLNGSAIDLTALLPDEDQNATLNVERVGFQNGGEYACKVTTDAGSLQTSTYTLSILVVPIITIPPRPIAVQEGHNMEFKCFAIGTPTPAIQWEYRGKMVGRGNILTIENADESDQGEYLCIAISSAGSSSVATRLTVFITDSVAVIIIKNVDQTSSDGTCHYLDPEILQKAVTSLSGVSTMITSVSADNLCEINSCSPSPCGNGGTCQLDDSVKGGYLCSCPGGYMGVDCMDDVNECLDSPCGPSSECTNIPGLFQCTCSGSTGNRCQYPSACKDTTCSNDKLCLESHQDLSGYVCLVIPDIDVMLTVTGAEVHPGFLDDLLVNYREALLQQRTTNNRRKRLSNNTLTTFADSVCNPRFIKLDPASSTHVLFWDCPPGKPSPPQDIQAVLCMVLVQSGLVASCQASNTSLLTRPTPPPPLPKISVTIELIQVDSSGEPLSIGQILNNLEQLEKSGILAGAEVDSVSAVNPIMCTLGCVNGKCTDRDTCTCDDGWTGATCDAEQLSQQESGTSTGVIVGVVVAVIVCGVVATVAVIVIFIIISKQRQHKKRQKLKMKYAREMESVSSAPQTTPPAPNNAPHPVSTETLRSSYCNNLSTDNLEEDNDYDELPPLTVKLDHELPALVNTSPLQGKK